MALSSDSFQAAPVKWSSHGSRARTLHRQVPRVPMIPALDVVWSSEGSVLKLRRSFNNAAVTQFLIRVNTLNL